MRALARAGVKRVEQVAFVRVENNGQREPRSADFWERVFGVQVKALRQECGWTQDDLAKQLTGAGHPMHQTTVAKIESGARPTNVGEIAAIAAIFGVQVSFLFDVSEDTDFTVALERLSRQLGDIEMRRSILRLQLVALDAEYEEKKALFERAQASRHLYSADVAESKRLLSEMQKEWERE